MHDASDIPWDLIADTLAGEQGDGHGERPRAERDALECWLAEQPAHRQLFAMAQSVWATDPAWTNPDVAMLKAKVSARIGVDVDRYKERPDHRERVSPLASRGGNSKAQPLPKRPWSTMAGVGLGALTLVIGWCLGMPKVNPRGSVPVSTYVTGNGERANITLPDGNTVALNVASRLEVPADYLAGDHTLRLNGEALFTIQHHVGVPVTILAGQTITRVLGTTFLVRHYITDTVVTVAVRDGRVAVGTTVVTAARLAEVGYTGVIHVGVVPQSQFSFATGVLTLDSMPLSVAIPELDRWYNTDIRLGDATLATKPVEGNVTAGSLSDLTAILELTGVRVVRNGRVLTLYPK